MEAADGRRRPPSVGGDRRRLPTVAAGRRRLPPAAVGRRRSPPVSGGAKTLSEERIPHRGLTDTAAQRLLGTIAELALRCGQWCVHWFGAPVRPHGPGSRKLRCRHGGTWPGVIGHRPRHRGRDPYDDRPLRQHTIAIRSLRAPFAPSVDADLPATRTSGRSGVPALPPDLQKYVQLADGGGRGDAGEGADRRAPRKPVRSVLGWIGSVRPRRAGSGRAAPRRVGSGRSGRRFQRA